MSWDLKAIHTHAWDFWLARASVALIAGLQLLMINDLTIGPRWLAPGLEIALLVPLSIATAWTQANARDAAEDHHWKRVAWERRLIRMSAICLTALVTVINFSALLALIHDLLQGHATKVGETLLLDALNIWVTNVIVFALWFWNIDHGGPAARGLIDTEKCDFLYPQMTLGSPRKPNSWSPGFLDYLYLSFTNATAFSPTDTLPLSQRAKMLMMVESAISLLTIALVAARAVNILA